MEKNKLLFLPFFVGLVLMIYSWYVSYPLSVNSVSDIIYNHVSILYWISIPILLTSMFMMATTFKSQYSKWILTVGFVIVLYSLVYFYFTMSTVDADYFRGLTENFIRTNSLNASQLIHNYYQWPSFFLLASITTLVSGLKLTSYEFLLFTIIGFLLSTALYIYASKAYNRSGFLMVAAFFVVMFLFLNYQAVPFSLAFALLLILFILETRERSAGTTLTMIILFISTVITHAFVPLFFVIYLLIRSIISRSRQYFDFFILTLVIFMVVQITFAEISFRGNIISAFTPPKEYSAVVGATLASTSVSIDAIPHLFSRTITIAFAVLCIAGFVFIVFRRKLREIDKAIFLTGAVYSGLGVVLSVLGTRAIAIVFVPISLGIAYLFESKFRKFLKYLVVVMLVIMLVFVVFVPIHSSLTSNLITFQTKEDLATANFMIEKYDWNSKSTVIADSGTAWYILPQIQGNTQIDTQFTTRFGLSNIMMYDSVIYSVGLAESLNMSNISVDNGSQQIMDRLDVVYNSGFSYIATKGS
ncbi:MAG: hypothetical protein ABSA75_09120 [Candidatus Bathyarchaeia archaeon]